MLQYTYLHTGNIMDKEKLHGCGCGCEEEKVENSEGCGCGCGCDSDIEEDGCGCGCGCEDGDHQPLVVELEDENGNIVPCEIVDGFEFKDNEYAIVQNPENESVYLFKVVGEGEEGELIIPEDEEFEEVSAYYEALANNEQ